MKEGSEFVSIIAITGIPSFFASWIAKASLFVSITNNKLKSTNVNAIAIDQNDYVWVGSDEGLIYFTTSKFDDIKNYDNYLTPNNGERNIFQNIKINDISDFKSKEYIIDVSGALEDSSGKKNINDKTKVNRIVSNNAGKILLALLS